MLTKRLKGFLLFNFLAKDKHNLADVLEAGQGYIIPGVTAADHDVSEAVQKIKTFKDLTNVVSVGLGGNGNVDNWRKALDIAALSDAGHVNQPFEKASFAMGYLNGQQKSSQWVNALVSPSGKKGTVRLPSGKEVNTQWLVEIVKALGIPSIKMMPVKGRTHLDELVDLTQISAKNGIRAVEPAGGISEENVKEIVNSVQNSGIELFIPHIFGSAIHPATKETMPEKVAKMIQKASE